MIRLSLFLALATVALIQGARVLDPFAVDLDSIAADAPAWLAELTERNA